MVGLDTGVVWWGQRCANTLSPGHDPLETMTQQDYKRPIVLPPELVEQWIEQFKEDHPIYVAMQAAQWGADQELEACCQWLHCHAVTEFAPGDLRAARRPKPPSLKKQALARLAELESDEPGYRTGIADIRRALERLPDNE